MPNRPVARSQRVPWADYHSLLRATIAALCQDVPGREPVDELILKLHADDQATEAIKWLIEGRSAHVEQLRSVAKPLRAIQPSDRELRAMHRVVMRTCEAVAAYDLLVISAAASALWFEDRLASRVRSSQLRRYRRHATRYRHRLAEHLRRVQDRHPLEYQELALPADIEAALLLPGVPVRAVSIMAQSSIVFLGPTLAVGQAIDIDSPRATSR